MAIGNTNVSLTTVRNTIGETSYSLFTIGTSALVNKWSYYKPIRDAGAGANWPRGLLDNSNGIYGLDIPNDSWDYLQPLGGSPGGYPNDSPVRLGDFRNYDHDATPPIQMQTYPSSNNTTLGGVATFRIHAPGASSIDLYDLGLDEYYFGIKIRVGMGAFTYYSAVNKITDGVGNDTLQITISGLTSGTTYRWFGFISAAQSVAGAIPVGSILDLPLDHAGTYIIDGSFTQIIPSIVSNNDINISYLGTDSNPGTSAIDVTPSDVEVALTKEDTYSEGTAWLRFTGGTTTFTGDFTLSVWALDENSSADPRRCTVVITETTSYGISHIHVVVTQEGHPD